LATISGPDIQHLPPAATWKFNDSWATNLTGITTAGAAFAALLADKASGTFRAGTGISFGVAAGVFTVLAALAPVLYSGLQSYIRDPSPAEREKNLVSDQVMPLMRLKLDEKNIPDELLTPRGRLIGTPHGLIVASWVTLLSVYGSLGAAFVFLRRDIPSLRGADQVVGGVALLAISIVVAIYAVRTLFWLLLDALRSPDSGSTLMGTVHVDCCAKDSKGARRLSLL